MINVAAIVLGNFQDDLVETFGNSIGWAIGHLILISFLALVIVVIRGREHVFNHSGIGRREVQDWVATIFLTLFLFIIYASVFDFESTASIVLAVASSVSLRWMIVVVG